MKYWDYYTENPHTYPNRFEWKKNRKAEIDEMKLTADEREEMLSVIDAECSEWFKQAVKQHAEFSTQREMEFWQDCRADIGYDKVLTEKGCAILEAAAYERGHSAGFSEVYGCLCDMWEWVEKIIREVK